MSAIAPLAPAFPAYRVSLPLQARRVGLFAAMTLVLSLALQRFAIPAGGQAVEAVGPAGLLLAVWALGQGVLRVHSGRLLWFIALALWLVLGALWQAVHPSAFGIAFSAKSFGQFLLLTGFCVLSFAEPLDEAVFFRRAGDILAVIAAAGILQFVLQFAGLRLFAFSGLLPERVLYESGYNLAIPVGIGALLKSNGLILLEPSIFSQVMAMGLIIEVLAARRGWYLVLFGIGLVLSFSGTGWIVLASFVLSAGARLGTRGIALAAGILAVAAVGVAALLLASPDLALLFGERASEINQPGTSGNLRFVTPFTLLGDVWAREGWAWLLGIGAGASEKLDLAYAYNVNTPVKILLEFGLPALVLYLGLILKAERTRLQGALVVPAMVLLLFTGGYQEFAPVLFPVFLLICVARLRPAPALGT